MKKGIAQFGAIAVIAIVIIGLFLLNVASFGIIVNKISSSPLLILVIFILLYILLKDKK